MIPSTTLLFTIPPPSHFSNPNPNFSSSQPPVRCRRRFRCRCRRAGDSRWDSNAESVRTGRFRFRVGEEEEEDEGEFRGGRGSSSSRRWWSDESADEFNDGFDPFDEDSEDIWDKIWIFKVFKAYGYMLPAIIGSLLLATGPKAFLMALAIPLGQSAISLAIEKLWGRATEGPRTKPKTKRRPFSRSSSNPRKQEKEGMGSGYKGRNNYQSWVSADSKIDDSMSDSTKSSFGGWDDLDNQKAAATGGSGQAETSRKGKLSKKGRYRDAPLFLRLLIAVFPFLGSWTRIL